MFVWAPADDSTHIKWVKIKYGKTTNLKNSPEGFKSILKQAERTKSLKV